MFVSDLLYAQHSVPTVVTEATRLIEVAKLLSAGAEMVLACDLEGRLQGVVTKTDIVHKISVCEGSTCLCPISSAMTRDIVVCGADDRLQDVSALMKERHLKNLPVIDRRNRPIGIMTVRAILRTLLGEVEGEAMELMNYVKGVGYR